MSLQGLPYCTAKTSLHGGSYYIQTHIKKGSSMIIHEVRLHTILVFILVSYVKNIATR